MLMYSSLLHSCIQSKLNIFSDETCRICSSLISDHKNQHSAASVRFTGELLFMNILYSALWAGRFKSNCPSFKTLSNGFDSCLLCHELALTFKFELQGSWVANLKQNKDPFKPMMNYNLGSLVFVESLYNEWRGRSSSSSKKKERKCCTFLCWLAPGRNFSLSIEGRGNLMRLQS